MDEMDKVILLGLSMNCRVSYQSLARKLGVSSNAIKKRVDHLIGTGVIERFGVELSLEMFEGDMALCILETDGTEDEQHAILFGLSIGLQDGHDVFLSNSIRMRFRRSAGWVCQG